jgi:hypothetical protein
MKISVNRALPLGLASAVLACGFSLSAAAQNAPAAAATPGKHITQGRATMTAENLYECAEKVQSFRKTPLGTITATDGKVLTVPAETVYTQGLKAGGELQNYCIKIDPQTVDEVKALTEKTPVVEIDPDGEVITGYLNSDNYFEMYVNEKLVGVDTVPFTPMNGSIIRFKVKRPYTIAIKLVDWEENLGLASELNRSNPWHPGDGGIMARFSDGTVTDSTWRAQSFYIGPLASPDDIVEARGNLHDTEKLGRTHPLAKMPTCQDKCYGVHYDIPADWKSKAFNDKVWPPAYEFTDEQMGINAMVSYTRFPDLFTDARWIWSLNLVYDNVVIVRKTVQ